MAGTRLLVQLTLTLQLFLLVITAVYLGGIVTMTFPSISNNKETYYGDDDDGKNWGFSMVEGGILVDRSGVQLLPHDFLNGSLVQSLRNRLDTLTFGIGFHLWIVLPPPVSNSTEEEEKKKKEEWAIVTESFRNEVLDRMHHENRNKKRGAMSTIIRDMTTTFVRLPRLHNLDDHHHRDDDNDNQDTNKHDKESADVINSFQTGIPDTMHDENRQKQMFTTLPPLDNRTLALLTLPPCCISSNDDHMIGRGQGSADCCDALKEIKSFFVRSRSNGDSSAATAASGDESFDWHVCNLVIMDDCNLEKEKKENSNSNIGAKLDIDEGIRTIFVRFDDQKPLSIQSLLSGPVAQAVYESILTPSTPLSLHDEGMTSLFWHSSTDWTVFISILYEDPYSYYKTKKHNNGNHISQDSLGSIVENVIQRTLHTMLSRLYSSMLLVHEPTIHIRTIPSFIGPSLSAYGKKRLVKNETTYVIDASNVYEFYKDNYEIFSRPIRYTKGDVDAGFFLDMILYIPRADKSPLYIRDSSRQMKKELEGTTTTTTTRPSSSPSLGTALTILPSGGGASVNGDANSILSVISVVNGLDSPSSEADPSSSASSSPPSRIDISSDGNENGENDITTKPKTNRDEKYCAADNEPTITTTRMEHSRADAAIAKAVSHFGAVLRSGVLGLDSRRPREYSLSRPYVDTSDNAQVSVEYMHPSIGADGGGGSGGGLGGGGGMTEWELQYIVRRVFPLRYRRVLEELNTQIELIRELTGVAVPEKVAQEFVLCSQHLQSSLDHAERGRLDLAMTDVNAALQLSYSIRTNSKMIEPLNFGLEHYLAVFAPLLLPLILPLIVGVIREFKRYKKLEAAKLRETQSL